MMKAGLLALAESYGLERGATQTLGRLGERFFELLGENFESLVAQRVKLLGLSQSVESFADFCTAAPSQHTLVCGVAGRPAMAFRIDHALTLGLVDGVLGKYDAPSSESAESPLTVTERRILVSVLKSALGAVAPLVFPALFADLLPAATVLQIIGARDEAGVIADTLEPAEPLIAMTAPYVINGRRGAIALGLTVASVAGCAGAAAAPAAPAVGTQRLRLTLGEILDELELGASLRLDRHAGDPVEVYVNGALFARAEVVVMQDQIGAKIIELVEAPPASRPSGLR